MKIIITLLSFYIVYVQNLSAQNVNQTWSHNMSGTIVSFNFGEEMFEIDSTNFYEGYVFYFKSKSDSSYFRMNHISPYAMFECCIKDSMYKESNRTLEKGVLSRNGKVNSTNLFWREISDENIEIVYNNCSNEKLKLYNKIMDSIYLKLVSSKFK
ncbi:MAG: hypothetical protein CFE21_13680 [Bacteroidetes bacterium B1(2017)]|nr:MAG: hypothetical protein CFE21_13680 [Bacteroidetes bacterium B1(2017)]